MRRFFRFTVLVLDALLVVLFLVGYTARYVHPRYGWWAELVAIGLPYLSMAALAATMLAAWRRRWKLLAGHLVLVALVLVRFIPAGWPVWERTPRPGDLTLLTYNVPRWWSDRQTEEKTRAMLRLVRHVEPDLISLQEPRVTYDGRGRDEVHALPFLDALADSLGFETLAPQAEVQMTTQQPVLSRFDVEDLDHFPLRVSLRDDETTQVTRVRFRWQGRPVVLYNVHLRSFGGRKPWEEDRLSPFRLRFWTSYLRQIRTAYRIRAREAEALRRLIAQETVPVIVTGDFNSTPHSWVYHHVAQGLRDAFKLAGLEWGATYHAELPFVRIDYVLFSEEFEVVEAYIPEPTELSDHRPLAVTLRWR